MTNQETAACGVKRSPALTPKTRRETTDALNALTYAAYNQLPHYAHVLDADLGQVTKLFSLGQVLFY